MLRTVCYILSVIDAWFKYLMDAAMAVASNVTVYVYSSVYSGNGTDRTRVGGRRPRCRAG